MTEVLYEWMTARQAADALDEFVAERAPALQRLRRALAEHDAYPGTMLNGTLGSVAALWEWITGRVDALGAAPTSLSSDPTRPGWPSWARHGMLVDPHPPAEALALVDGFVSYLGEVVAAAVPAAQWQVGQHHINDYPMLHRPVLAADDHQVFLPFLPLYSAYQTLLGRDPMDGQEMVGHVQRTISALRGEGPEAAATEEPFVTVVAEVDCYDVGLRADIAERHPELVKRMTDELADRDGVESVHRYGPAALVVNAPSWEEIRLKLWLTLWLQRHLPR